VTNKKGQPDRLFTFVVTDCAGGETRTELDYPSRADAIAAARRLAGYGLSASVAEGIGDEMQWPGVWTFGDDAASWAPAG
jgi:hypothetical protein